MSNNGFSDFFGARIVRQTKINQKKYSVGTEVIEHVNSWKKLYDSIAY